MSVRAKFKCTSITNTENGASIQLDPVVSGSKENENFYKWTPGGSVLLSTVNDAAAAEFTPGGEYYVDFSKAE